MGPPRRHYAPSAVRPPIDTETRGWHVTPRARCWGAAAARRRRPPGARRPGRVAPAGLPLALAFVGLFLGPRAAVALAAPGRARHLLSLLGWAGLRPPRGSQRARLRRPGARGRPVNAAPGVVAVALVTLATLLIGTWGLRFSRTTSDFFVASRTVRLTLNASAMGVPSSGLVHGSVAGLVPSPSGADMPENLDGGSRIPRPPRPGGGACRSGRLPPDFAEALAGSRGVRRLLADGGRGRLALPAPCSSRARASRCARRRAPPDLGRSGHRRGRGPRERHVRRHAEHHLRRPPSTGSPDRPPGRRSSCCRSGPATDSPTPSAATAGRRPPPPGRQGLYLTYSLIVATFLGTMGLPHVVVLLHQPPTAAPPGARRSWVLALLGLFCLLLRCALGPSAGSTLRARRERAVQRARPELTAHHGRRAGWRGPDGAGGPPGRPPPVHVLGTVDRGRRRPRPGPDRPGAGRAIDSAASPRSAQGGPRGDRPVRAVALAAPNLGVARAVGLAFAMAASTFCPASCFGIWWRRLTGPGAVAGMSLGRVCCSVAIGWTLLTRTRAGGRTR